MDRDKLVALAGKLTPRGRAAMLTRDGQGEFSSTTFDALLKLGLIDHSLHFTDLGVELRRALASTPREGDGS